VRVENPILTIVTLPKAAVPAAAKRRIAADAKRRIAGGC
jgi:hypothetical protein